MENSQTNVRKTSKKTTLITVSILAIIVVGILITLFVINNKSFTSYDKVTYQNFQKIESGMTYTEVSDILGDNDTELEIITDGGYKITTHTWNKSTDPKNDKKIDVDFDVENKVISAKQYGFDDEVVFAAVTKENYDKIELGMELSDVMDILGEYQSMTTTETNTGYTIISYTWLQSLNQSNNTKISIDCNTEKNVISKNQVGLN